MSDRLTANQARLMIVVLGLIAFAPVLRVGFLWDDHVLIEANPFIRSWSLQNIRHDVSATVSNGLGDAGFLRPLVTWSNRLDYSLWKLNPMGYHATSLLLHLGNALLLFELVLVLGCAPLAAFLTASLFAVHPIGVEGLLCVTGRATFLSFFFGIASIVSLVKPTPVRILLGLLSFAAALLSKEVSVVVPFLLVLVWIVRREEKKRIALLVPLMGVLGAYLLYRQFLFGSLGEPSDRLYTLRFFVQAFPRVLNHYVELLLIPWNLHSHRLLMRMSHIWFLWFAGWSCLVAWCWYKRREYPFAFFCVSWLILGLLPPALAMVNGGFMLDHWGYWIAPAILLPLGLLFDHAWTKQRSPKYRRLALSYFAVLAAYALLVRLNIELRNTDEKMYRWALHFTTSNPIKYNLGVVLLQSGRAREAIPYFSAVRDAYPSDPRNGHALAVSYFEAGHKVAGIKTMKQLLKNHPDFVPAQESFRAMQKKS